MLAAIPSLFFALAALPGAMLIGRVGAVPSLFVGLLLNAAGALARGFSGGAFGLELATALMCLGVAVMQPAMPTLTRRWAPTRIALASATYTCGLLCGEVLPILWPFAPDLPLIGTGWRASLAQWCLPVLATIVVIALGQPRARREPAPAAPPVWSNWRTGPVWKVGLLLGAVNASYFGLNGFLPGWLSHGGGQDLVRPALLALNAGQIPASILMMAILDRLVFRRAAYLAAGAGLLVGSVGLATAPHGAAIAFATLAGFSLGCLLTLALALPALLVEAARVPGFSAAVFTVSYTIAVLTALGTGLLNGMDPSPWLGVAPIAAGALAILAVGGTVRPVPGGEPERTRAAPA